MELLSVVEGQRLDGFSEADYFFHLDDFFDAVERQVFLPLASLFRLLLRVVALRQLQDGNGYAVLAHKV